MRFLVLPVSQQGRNTRLAFFMTFKYICLLVPTKTRCVVGQGKKVIKDMENCFKMVQVNFGGQIRLVIVLHIPKCRLLELSDLGIFPKVQGCFFFFQKYTFLTMLKSPLADLAERRTPVKQERFNFSFRHIITFYAPYILC